MKVMSLPLGLPAPSHKDANGILKMHPRVSFGREYTLNSIKYNKAICRISCARVVQSPVSSRKSQVASLQAQARVIYGAFRIAGQESK